VFALLVKEKRLAALFPIPSTLAARHRSTPASKFVNLVAAMCWFVQNEIPSSPAWEFLWLLGLVLEQPLHRIGRTSWFVMDSDCSIAPRQRLLLFAFPQALARQM
jgi:hypothetical protein